MRRVLAGLAAVSVVGVTVATGAFAAPSTGHVTAGRNAAAWLGTQFEDGLLQNLGLPDVGLTVDALLGLRATGADRVTVATVTDAVAAQAAAWAIADIDLDEDGSPDVRIIDAGSTSKLLFAAVATGRDPKAFGGLDLDAMTRDLIAADGDHRGRVRDVNPDEWGGDQSNVFDQSLATLGLAGSGGVPADVVSYLLRQQCPSGGFRLNPDPTGAACTDDGAADVDATAMAVQALVAADADEAAGKAAAWLVGLQAADGSFRNGPQNPDPWLSPVANSNSTGLAAQALAATGHADEANEAAAWVAALQWTSGDDSGAIAYSRESWAAGPPHTGRAHWRRAPAPALLGLAQVPLGEIAGVPAGEPSSPSSSSPSSPSSSSSPSPSASPSASSASASPSVSASASASGTAAPGGNLAVTGQPVMHFAVYAVGMILLGAMLVVAARRRRSA